MHVVESARNHRLGKLTREDVEKEAKSTYSFLYHPIIQLLRAESSSATQTEK